MRPSSLRLTMLRKSAPTTFRMVLWTLVVLALSTGCKEFEAAVSRGWDGVEYEDRYLSTSSPLGAKALKNWRNLDIDIREFLQDHRDPDVIYSEFNEVTFFYLEEKVQVRCVRGGWKTKIEQTTIPEFLYQELCEQFD